MVNHPEDAPSDLVARQIACAASASDWARMYDRPHLRLHVLLQPLPPRSAGVGLARKIGMDEACHRLESVGCPYGVIACFDADCRCDDNYLEVLYRHFATLPAAMACGIRFEHPLAGAEFPASVYEAVTAYETHLRYYVNAQRWSGIPHAWHTVGSSMAVRCRPYQAQGGMNRRKAGEDFYFLHKFIPLGGFTEIHDTCVYPSPRPSERVPFGTGRAILGILERQGAGHSYNPAIFRELRTFVRRLDEEFYRHRDLSRLLNGLPEGIGNYLSQKGIGDLLDDAFAHTASFPAFLKRFWRGFNGLQVLKYVHYARSAHYPDVPVELAAGWLGTLRGAPGTIAPDHRLPDLLRALRELDRVYALERQKQLTDQDR